jgi:hypothetical protein
MALRRRGPRSPHTGRSSGQLSARKVCIWARLRPTREGGKLPGASSSWIGYAEAVTEWAFHIPTMPRQSHQVQARHAEPAPHGEDLIATVEVPANPA